MTLVHICYNMATSLLYFTQSNGLESKIIENSKFAVIREDFTFKARFYEISSRLLEEIIQDYIAKLDSTNNQVKKVVYLGGDSNYFDDFKTKFSRPYIQIRQVQESYPKNQEFYQLAISNRKIYNFIECASILDFRLPCDYSKLNYLNSLPNEFLQVQFEQNLHIYHVKLAEKRLISKILVDEKFNIRIITKILNDQVPKDTDNINSIINAIFEKGNSQNADLLVEDIFGSDNCSVIGLPPKLVAASLAKLALQQFEGKAISVYDKLSSILTAFAINTGLAIKHEIFKTQIKMVVYRAKQLYNDHILNIIQSMLAETGELWIIKEEQINFAGHLISQKVIDN